MKNPCLSCYIHLQGAAKRNVHCRQCSERVAYVRSLGAMTFSVPDRQCDYLSGSQPKEDTTVIKHQDLNIRVCAQCEKSFENEAVAENFNRSFKSKDGLMKICKACQGQRMAFGQQKRWAATKKKTAPATVSTTAETPKPAETASGLWIDFSGLEAVLQDLTALAACELRTVENQALYLIKAAVAGCRSEG